MGALIFRNSPAVASAHDHDHCEFAILEHLCISAHSFPPRHTMFVHPMSIGMHTQVCTPTFSSLLYSSVINK